MTKITPQIKLSILSTLAIIIVAITVIFIILPLQNKIKALSQNIYDQRVNFEFISQQKQNIVHLEREIKEIENRREKISPAIFSRNETLELINSLETIAQNNNIRNQKLDLTNPSALDSGLMMSTITINFITSYKDYLNWLLEIEKQPYYIIIDSIGLNSNSSEKNLVTAVITAKVYWQ